MYDSVQSDIEGIFAGSSWTSHSIPIYPDNYQGAVTTGAEFCRLSVLPSNSENYAHGGNKSLSGIVVVKILVRAGEGQKRIMAISDILDVIFDNKTLTNGTELSTSYLNMEGLDPANKSLYSARYLIPFKIYGE
jgi:hypothetical protein